MKILFILCALSFPIFSFGFIDASTPKGAVETIIEKAKGLDNQATRTENQKTIESLVDFQKLASDALGDRKSEASAAQQAQIRDLLKDIITKTVYPEAPKFFKDVTVKFTVEEPSDSKTHISSLVIKGEKRTTVDYWLAKEGGAYRVVDLAIEGERWVENVHDQFDEIIRTSGVNGLIAKMQKKSREIGVKPSKGAVAPKGNRNSK